MSKIVKLKKGLQAELHLKHDNSSFYLYATDITDSSNEQKAYCLFSITFVCSHILTEEERLAYSQRYRIPISKVPHCKDVECIEGQIERVTKNHVILKTGEKYLRKETICNLGKIEILDKKFFKVGLGTRMIHVVEKVAQKYNCTYIEGVFLPFGEFACGSELFYDRNGFDFKKGDEGLNLTYVYKNCTPKTYSNDT